ncbi:MAG: hypothetical protein JNM00_15320 [Flavobacteriales bacterium]|nr:hypothetical protein [Flavobacteriales bacterium]
MHRIPVKWLNALVVLSSLIGYLEWGQTSSTFLIQGEWKVITSLFSDAGRVVHPLTMLPLLGQLLLIVTLFQKEPSRWLAIIGVICIALLMVLVFGIGIMAGNAKMIIFGLPFMVFSVLCIIKNRPRSRNPRIN